LAGHGDGGLGQIGTEQQMTWHYPMPLGYTMPNFRVFVIDFFGLKLCKKVSC